MAETTERLTGPDAAMLRRLLDATDPKLAVHYDLSMAKFGPDDPLTILLRAQIQRWQYCRWALDNDAEIAYQSVMEELGEIKSCIPAASEITEQRATVPAVMWPPFSPEVRLRTQREALELGFSEEQATEIVKIACMPNRGRPRHYTAVKGDFPIADTAIAAKRLQLQGKTYTQIADALCTEHKRGPSGKCPKHHREKIHRLRPGTSKTTDDNVRDRCTERYLRQIKRLDAVLEICSRPFPR